VTASEWQAFLATWTDAAVYLLNPRVTTSSGEWEAWCLASWSPEAERFPSFEAMMRARFQNFRDGIIDGF
jgi:hypothetical protein